MSEVGSRSLPAIEPLSVPARVRACASRVISASALSTSARRRASASSPARRGGPVPRCGTASARKRRISPASVVAWRAASRRASLAASWRSGAVTAATIAAAATSPSAPIAAPRRPMRRRGRRTTRSAPQAARPRLAPLFSCPHEGHRRSRGASAAATSLRAEPASARPGIGARFVRRARVRSHLAAALLRLPGRHRLGDRNAAAAAGAVLRLTAAQLHLVALLRRERQRLEGQRQAPRARRRDGAAPR